MQHLKISQMAVRYFSQRQRRDIHSVSVLCIPVHTERPAVPQLHRQPGFQQRRGMLQRQRRLGHVPATGRYDWQFVFTDCDGCVAMVRINVE